MPSRRFHGKTKTGCLACKARHVKCGEQDPICYNCRRRNTPCVYPACHISRSRSSSVQGERSPPTGTIKDIPGAFDSLDLVLMHRYCTATSSRLMPVEAHHLWQFTVPAKAEIYPILQHGMLALAALDLAAATFISAGSSSVQLVRYRSRGLQHQQMALPLFRTLLQHEEPGAENAIFLFSIILLFLSFASANSAATRPTLDEISDLFALFRGPRALWERHERGVNRHLIEAMFSTLLPFELRDENFRRESYQDPELDSLAVDEATTEAVWHLKRGRAIATKMPGDLRAIMWFPALAGEAFFEQVRQHRPAALSILSKYASILELFRSWWWIGSWGVMLELAIQDVVREESITLPR